MSKENFQIKLFLTLLVYIPCHIFTAKEASSVNHTVSEEFREVEYSRNVSLGTRISVFMNEFF